MFAGKLSKGQPKATENVAAKVVPEVHHTCVCGGMCPRCQAAGRGEDGKRLQDPRVQRFDSDGSRLPLHLSELLASPGRPLESSVLAFLEPRFGHSFSDVKLHTGDEATRLARALSARAFTFDRHVVFDAGQYEPRTSAGQRLIAHEMAHVVQQRGHHPASDTAFRVSTPGDVPERQADVAAHAVMKGLSVRSLARTSNTLQRKCHEDELGKPALPCTRSDQGVIGWQLLFKVGCDDLLPGEDKKLASLKTGGKYNVHGFASREGKPEFNDELSCHRANMVAGLISAQRPDCQVQGRFKHGASPAVAPGLVPDPHPLGFWRNVIIEEIKPTPGRDPNEWVNPSVAVITDGWPLYNQAKKDSTASNLDAVASHRPKLKAWLEGIAKLVAPEGAQLSRKDISNYRKYYDSAENLWRSMDQLLAQQNHAAAAKDTYSKWAAGEGKEQSVRHAKDVPPGAKYHIDVFGEGRFPGAINLGIQPRTTTTGVFGTRVPYLIYRRFSGKAANHIPIADHVADLVTSENGPIDWPGVPEEIARIIAPGGVIVLFNPDMYEPAHEKIFKLTGGTMTKDFRQTGTIETKIVVPGP